MPDVANAGVTVYAGLMYGFEKKANVGVCANAFAPVGTLLSTWRFSES